MKTLLLQVLEENTDKPFLKDNKVTCWILGIKGAMSKENRIYTRVEFTRKKCKTAILLYCFHTAGVLNIIVLYNLLGLGISSYRKSKIYIKRKPNYEIGWFHN